MISEQCASFFNKKNGCCWHVGIGIRCGLKIRCSYERVGSRPTASIMKTYELFTGKDLEIAEKIQQRRYQMLIHSCLYYHLNQNVISDKQWDAWARELRDLQNEYPDISSQVILYDEFKDWDASTGAFLPIEEPWVVKAAKKFLGVRIQVSLLK